ncbi:LppU/SCO3897 family protein [Pseudonocardia sp. TRM90224]|uniref:LppU/SCO3897 family protein n=1 Tax=Pseudonocardia sp. TRM90224 TaxID=2812678 RepID=UPI001E47C6CE|nr:hypothetical protein [Pseudonocardia sp. TRM90224]
MRIVRNLCLLVPAIALLLGALAGCAGLQLETGACAKLDGEQFVAVECTDPAATYRVLERPTTDNACYDVAGTTYSYYDSRVGGELCMGPKDVDPATAINVAKKDDCLTDVHAPAPSADTVGVRKVDCGAPDAVHRVLAREERSSISAGLQQECSKVPGTTESYAWSLRKSGDAPLANLYTELVFCLAPKDADPNASADLAQAGDCLAESGDTYTRVGCGDPTARYRVLERNDSALLGVELACRSVEGATTGVQRKTSDFSGYTLCLSEV